MGQYLLAPRGRIYGRSILQTKIYHTDGTQAFPFLPKYLKKSPHGVLRPHSQSQRSMVANIIEYDIYIGLLCSLDKK
jgi:hypothetical protein